MLHKKNFTYTLNPARRSVIIEMLNLRLLCSHYTITIILHTYTHTYTHTHLNKHTKYCIFFSIFLQSLIMMTYAFTFLLFTLLLEVNIQFEMFVHPSVFQKYDLLGCYSRQPAKFLFVNISKIQLIWSVGLAVML